MAGVDQDGVAELREREPQSDWRRCVGCLWVLLLAAGPVAAATRTDVALEYAARKLFIKAEAGVRWVEPSAETRPQGELEASVWTRSPGENSRLDLSFRADSGAAITREQRYSDGKTRTYRFGEEGVQYDLVAPLRNERRLPKAEWTDRFEGFYPLPEGFEASRIVAPSALFYLLPRLGLDAIGDQADLQVFSKREFYELKLEVVARPVIAVDWVEERDAESKRWKAPGTVLHVRASLAGRGEGMSLLGLQGDLDFFLHPELKIPLKIGGRVPILGRVVVSLKKASWVTLEDK